MATYNETLDAIRRQAQENLAAGVSEADLRAYGANIGLTPAEIDYALGRPTTPPTKTSDLEKVKANDAYITSIANQLGDKSVSAKEQLALSDSELLDIAENVLTQKGKTKTEDLAAYGEQLGLNQDIVDYMLGTDKSMELGTGNYNIGANVDQAIPKELSTGNYNIGANVDQAIPMGQAAADRAAYNKAFEALKASIPTVESISDKDWYATEDLKGDKKNPNTTWRDPMSGYGIGVETKDPNDPTSQVVGFKYYDSQGRTLRSSIFNPAELYRNAEEFGIDLSGISELGQKLDAAGTSYKPGQLYAGTGSDHGINFNAIAKGGLGSTYDWTTPTYRSSSDPDFDQANRIAAEQQQAKIDMAKHLGIGSFQEGAQGEYTKLLNDLRTAARGQLGKGAATKEQLETYGRNLGLSPEAIQYALGGDDVKAPAFSPYNLQELRKDIGLDAATTAVLNKLGDKDVSAAEQLLFSDPAARQLALNTADLRFLESGEEDPFYKNKLADYGKSTGLDQDLVDYMTGKDTKLELSYEDAIRNITGGGNVGVVDTGNKAGVVDTGGLTNTGNLIDTGNLINTGGTKTITRTFADEPDITGKSVPVQGESGLREFYGPYVQQMMQNMSALNALREDPNYRPMKFGDTYGQETAGALSDLAYTRGKRLGDNQDTLKSFTPFNYSFAPDKKAARGGLMSLMPERYVDGGAVGNTYTAQTVPSTFTAPAENYQSTKFSSGFSTPSNIYTASPITAGTGTFDATAQQQYMNPYMSGVVDPAVREAKRQSEIAGLTNAAKATQSGAFGGSRFGLMEAERQRNLMTQVGDIYGKGQASAFENAQKAFEEEQKRKLTAGIESEKAKQVGGQQALSSAEITARLGLEAQGLTEKSKQFGAQYGLDVGKTTAEYDQRARELQQRAEEAQARGDQFAAEQALRELDSAQRAAEASRAFEYQQGRDTYLDPYRELMYQSQLLSGLPIKAGDTGVSPVTEALISMLGLGNLMGVGGATKTSTKP
jgi:hypothetical protein